MARLWTCGFELNSAASGMEVSTVVGGPTVQATTKRSGGYAGRITSLVSATRQAFDQQFLSAAAGGPFYARTWVNFATLPSAENAFIGWHDGTATRMWVTVDSGGTVRIRASTGTLYGTSTTTLATGTWYCLLTLFYRVGAGSDYAVCYISTETAVLEGIGSITADLGGTIYGYSVGGNLKTEAQTQGDWYLDDVAVNNQTGTYEVSFPPIQGKIVHLLPDAAGDNAMGSRGGTDTGSDWGQVSDDPTPDDATDYYILDANNDILDVSLEDPANEGIDGRLHAIVVVAVGARLRNSATAGQPMVFHLRLKSQSGGTLQDGAVISNSGGTTWLSHDDTVPKIHSLVSYVDPQNGNRWTSNRLLAAQIGVQATDAAPDGWFTALWAAVEYKPARSFVHNVPHPMIHALVR